MKFLSYNNAQLSRIQIFQMAEVIFCCTAYISFATGTYFCPPLVAPKDTNLTCEFPHDQQRISCSSSWLKSGTIAYYECPSNNGDGTTKRGRIKCKGSYRLRDINGSHANNTDIIGSLPCGMKEQRSSTEFHIYGYKRPRNQVNNTIDVIPHNNGDFKDYGLQLHNDFRERHGSTPLKLDAQLTKKAQDWADELSTRSQLDMASEPTLGQNIYISNEIDSTSAVNDAVQFWYNVGLSSYNWRDVKANWNDSVSLDFSQVVWKSTKKLGLGVSKMKSDSHVGSVVVAFYFPWGNVVLEDINQPESQFLANVLPLS